MASPSEAGHQDEQGDEEEAGELTWHGSRVAQVLLAAVVSESVGAGPVGGVALQGALGPWEAALPLDDLSLFYGTEVVGGGEAEVGQEGGKGQGGPRKGGMDGCGDDLRNVHQTRVLLPEVPILMPQTSSS